MHKWEQTLCRVLPDFSLLERLFAIRELVWRREKLLEPLSDKAEAAVQVVLGDIDCQTRKIGGIEHQSAPWADIREAWRDLAMALLTAARQRFDRDAFDRRLAGLQAFLDDHPDVPQRVHHEKCLWALYALDFTDLDKLLKEWRPEGCDPAWMTRKAAILVETNRDDEAVRLLNRSLSIVREARRDGTLASPSREGWTLWLALAFDRDFLPSTGESLEAPPAFSRWRQLANLQCDAFAQKQDLLLSLRGDPEKKDGPLFDLGARRGKTIRFSNVQHELWITARRAIRLSEVAGLPPYASHMVVAADILALAVDRLVNTDYALASRLVLRLERTDDPTFNRVWARPRIAAMPMEEVTALVALVTNCITYALPRAVSASTPFEFWVTRLHVDMEALSRLVLRLPAERAEDIFKQGLSYYRMEGIAKHRSLAEPIYHLLARAWEALPKPRRADLIFDVLSTPIAELDKFEISDGSYPDPGELLVDDDEITVPARTPETEERWSQIVQMMIGGLHSGGEARQRAASRLVTLALWGRISEIETGLVVQALWHPDHTDSYNLPSGTSLYDWEFLLLPEPEPGLSEQRFRRKWLGSQEPENEKGINELFYQSGNALTSLRHYQRPLTLTIEERAKLATMVEKWLNFPVSSDDDSRGDSGTREGVGGLQSVLPEIDLSPPVAEALFSKVIALNQTNTPGFRLFASLAKSMTNRLEEIEMSMRMGLASDNVAVAEEAVLGLNIWLRAASEAASKVPAPPGDLLREIGVMIATRRKGVLHRALQVARWIFSSGSTEQRDAIAQSTLHGLRYLIEELRYDRDHGEDDAVDIPLLRWGCAHLALAMSASGCKADSTVMRWAEVALDDPLPEVRHAEGPALVHTRERGPAGN